MANHAGFGKLPAIVVSRSKRSRYRDGEFESVFLQERVCCEPDPICLAQTKQGSGFSARPAGVQMAATIAFCSCTERAAPSK